MSKDEEETKQIMGCICYYKSILQYHKIEMPIALVTIYELTIKFLERLLNE